MCDSARAMGLRRMVTTRGHRPSQTGSSPPKCPPRTRVRSETSFGSAVSWSQSSCVATRSAPTACRKKALRLVPAVFRLDLWSPDCWREQAENRRKRRGQVQALALRVAAIPEGIAVILGGDFNAPQGDAVFRELRPRLHDTFPEGGRGWGNTIVNDLPCLRIDQVWASGPLRAANVVARRTRGSDHRIVICDLAIEP